MIKKSRLFLPFIPVFVALFLAFGYLGYLQIWQREEYIAKVSNQVVRENVRQGWRGRIFDRHGRLLVGNRQVKKLFADARMIDNPEEIAEKISRLTNLSSSWVLNQLARKSRYIILKDNLTADEIQEIIRWRCPGLGIVTETERYYPEGDLAKNILGIYNENVNCGLELALDKYLRGRTMTQKVERDALGQELPLEFYSPQNLAGNDIYLTIDRNIQYNLENSLWDIIKTHGARRAMGVVQDPNTGQILAMANVGEDILPGSNFLVTNVYEPGSTLKLITYSAALATNLIKLDEPVNCENGRYQIYDRTITDHEPLGIVSWRQAFAHSSNIAAAKIGQKIGARVLETYLRNFGLGSFTGIGLPGESRGQLPRYWYPITPAIVAYGYGVGVTPLQLINCYSTIANGGQLLEPQIVLKVINPDGKKIFGAAPRVLRRVVPVAVAEQMKDLLREVVESGTGQRARIDDFVLGGKTGTARKIQLGRGQYSSTDYLASFCGIAPLSEPRLVCLVVVDNPGRNYYGGEVAAPAVARIMKESLQYLALNSSDDYWQLVRNIIK